jgi:tetratricopeptide (TPR) repeat protein
VNNAFLSYLTDLSKSLPNFSWTHAEPAEPRELSAKVLAAIQDCNVLIAIATKREAVAAPHVIGRSWFRSDIVQIPKLSIEWKTSDWIIQEIGLARGRDLHVILLCEAGVREPGGLLGNVEYIRFDRDRPEKSYTKISEMVRAISPPSRGSIVAQSEDAAAPSSEKTPPLADQVTVPAVDWDFDRYRHEFFLRILRGDEQGTREIDDAYLSTPEAGDPTKRAEWQAMTEGIRLRFGKGGNLLELRALADANPETPRVQAALAAALAKFDDHDAAAVRYQAAAAAVVDEADRVFYAGLAAIEFAVSGSLEAARTAIEQQKLIVVNNRSLERELLNTIREYAEITRDNDLYLSVLERLSELDPSNTEIRFTLAHKHAEAGNDDLSLANYLRIPLDDRGAGTWNNLGVAYSAFGIQARAVEAFGRSGQLGNTIALSNLANRFMNIGFLDEARSLLNKARKDDDFDKAISEADARLKSVPEGESKLVEETLEKSKDKWGFFKEMGRAVSDRTPKDISGNWSAPQSELTVSTTGDELIAIGYYEQSSTNALFGTTYGLPQRPIRYKLTYTAKLSGRLAIGTVKRERVDGEPAPTSVLGSFASEAAPSKFAAVVSKDERTMLLAENPYAARPTFQNLSRI